MSYLGELITMLVTEELVTLWGPCGQIAVMAGHRRLLGPDDLGEFDDPDGWVVMDYQRHPEGQLMLLSSPQEAAARVLDACGTTAPPVRRLLAARAYRRMFPIGHSMDWPMPDLNDWSPPLSWRLLRACS